MPNFNNANTSRISAKNINSINFSSYKGVVNGNIFETTPYPEEPVVACDNNLDFSCQDNSEYIPLI